MTDDRDPADFTDRPFVPFPVPTHRDDVPLVRHAGYAYECSGCGGPVPDGATLLETVEDGMVVGLLVRMGLDGPVVHRCGRQAPGGD